MRKIIAFIGAYTCYYTGDLLSRLSEYEIFEFLWTPYQKLMFWSSSIQDWGGLKGPWKEPLEKNVSEKEIEY